MATIPGWAAGEARGARARGRLRRARSGHAGARRDPARGVPALRGAFFNLPARRRADPRGLAIGRALRRPDPEGVGSGVQCCVHRDILRVGRTADALKGGRPSTDYTPPPAPAAPAAAPGEAPLRVDVQWNAVDDPSAPVVYRIYRDGLLVATSSAGSWTDTAVAGSTTYRYVIRALDAAGNLGQASVSAEATTPAPALPPPQPTPVPG